MTETSPARHSGSGKYRTLFELGQGGTANVLLAVARGPEGRGELVVVKRLRSIYVQDADFRAMFTAEGRLSARLDHPHVVKVSEVFEEDPPTIVMEYIEGQTLDTVLSLPEPKLPRELHLRVLVDVLSGLHYSHELRGQDQAPLEVVHRDVSPHNVMVSYDGIVKVLDFGIAQLAGTTIETETGVVKGKLRYMPPEQVSGDEVDRRADVFAVGVMLWEALSGARLWKGMPDAAIMNRVLAGAIPEPKREGEPIDAELLAICKRALAPERRERYQTALELQRALEQYLSAHCPSASPRELSRFMMERFGQAREDTARRVAAALARLDVSPLSRTGGTASRGPSTELPRSRVWLVALGFVLLGLAIVAWGVRAKGEASLTPAPAVAAAAASARRVTVSIRARPESAEVSLDGVPVANPYVAAQPLDSVPHVVRISAPGFQPEETSVRFDRDVRIVTALAPLPSAAPFVPGASSAGPARPRAWTAPPTPASSASAEPTKPPPDPCDPPFYYAAGIKTFKPECL